MSVIAEIVIELFVMKCHVLVINRQCSEIHKMGYLVTFFTVYVLRSFDFEKNIYKFVFVIKLKNYPYIAIYLSEKLF